MSDTTDVIGIELDKIADKQLNHLLIQYYNQLIRNKEA